MAVGVDLLLEGSSERQQAPLIHVEPPLLVATDDVEGERWSVPGRVPVRDQQLQDAAARGLALLQGNV